MESPAPSSEIIAYNSHDVLFKFLGAKISIKIFLLNVRYAYFYPLLFLYHSEEQHFSLLKAQLLLLVHALDCASPSVFQVVPVSLNPA